ncbi:MAG: acyltransferase [Erysipelotrichaceae bacterium]|nr:acyltransferase [Erysipelotrichaceae bacterium]
MRRKLFYGFRIIYNCLRLPLLRLFSLNKIKCSIFQVFSPSVKIRTFNNGEIEIQKKALIEDNVLLESNGGKIHMEGGFINRNTTIVSMESIMIESKVSIGPNVCIYDHDHNMNNSDGKRPFICSPIKIKRGAWIGAGAIILKGVTVGSNAVVAAGAVVTQSIPDNAIARGVPARIIYEKDNLLH